MRRALAAFNAHQQQGLAIRELYSARIEDTVRGIRPMIGNEDRVVWMAYEEIVEAVVALDGASVRCVSALTSSEAAAAYLRRVYRTLVRTRPMRAIEESLF